jgi:hypothetical protein
MAYFRSNVSVGSKQVTAGTTGAGTAASMPNTGTSIIANTSGEAFVLQAPVTGCKKRIILTSLSTAALCVIRTSTTSGGAPSIVGATTGINTITETTLRALTTPLVIDLEGFNSTSWVITSIFPDSSLMNVVSLSSA